MHAVSISADSTMRTIQRTVYCYLDFTGFYRKIYNKILRILTRILDYCLLGGRVVIMLSMSSQYYSLWGGCCSCWIIRVFFGVTIQNHHGWIVECHCQGFQDVQENFQRSENPVLFQGTVDHPEHLIICKWAAFEAKDYLKLPLSLILIFIILLFCVSWEWYLVRDFGRKYGVGPGSFSQFYHRPYEGMVLGWCLSFGQISGWRCL